MPNTDKFALSELVFDEVSTVPAGDNTGAHIVLSKAKVETPKKTIMSKLMDLLKAEGVEVDDLDEGAGDGSEDSDGTTIVKTPTTPGGEATVPKTKEEIIQSLPADIQKDVETLIEEERTAAETELVETLAEFDADEDGDDGDDEDDGTDVDDVLAKASPEVKAYFAKMQEQIDTAQAQVEIEKEARLDREMLSKAQDLKNIPGTPEEKATLLKSAYAVSDEHGKAVEKTLKESNAALDNAELFGEIGKSTSGDVTISAATEGKVAELMKADPTLTPEQALVKVWESDPALFDEAKKEAN